MYYLFFILISISSVICAVIKPSLLEVINNSSKEENYKCSYLRSTKLFAPDIIKRCPSLNDVQSLKTVDVHNVDSGLCILYYNNFENLCYLTNKADHIDAMNSSLSEKFDKDIDLVCTVLKNNTHFVENAKPGIIAVTDRLNKVCKRLCTDFDDAIKPICSLSAYMSYITTIVEKEKSALVKTKVATNKTQVDASLKIPLSDQAARKPVSINKTNKPSFTSPDKVISNKTNSGISHNKESITSTVNSQTSNPLSNELDTSNNVILEPTTENAQMLNVSQNTKTGEVKSTIITNEENISGNNLNENINHPKTDEPVTENKKISDDLNVQKLNKTPIKSVSVQPKIPPVVDEFHEPPVQNSYDDLSKDNKVQGREGEVLPNAKEDGSVDDDIEIEEAMPPPVADGNMDYGNEVLPKSSEVKSKTEVEKVSEKLKPSQTDEERYSISANYQNQNIDDSDSYFFSYFMMFCVIFICGYVAYHNKQKILALVVEGRRGRRPSRTRRPNSANYHKLDSNLEEAVTSTCNKNAPQVIY